MNCLVGNNILGCLLLFTLGSSLGSFFILVGSRTAKKQSIVKPSSHCPNCRTQLKIYELIPVFSWAFLGGKCRTCQTRIPVSYILLEALSGIVLLSTSYLLAWSPETIVAMTFYYLLLTMTISELEEDKIPNAVLLPFFIIGIFERILISSTINWSINPFFSLFIGFSIFSLLFLNSKTLNLFVVLCPFIGLPGSMLTIFLLLTYNRVIKIAVMKKNTLLVTPFIAVISWGIYLYLSNQLLKYFSLVKVLI